MGWWDTPVTFQHVAIYAVVSLVVGAIGFTIKNWPR